jgi:hypothetical protein
MSNNRIINDWIRKDMKLVMTYFKVQSWHLHGRAEKNQTKKKQKKKNQTR